MLRRRWFSFVARTMGRRWYGAAGRLIRRIPAPRLQYWWDSGGWGGWRWEGD